MRIYSLGSYKEMKKTCRKMKEGNMEQLEKAAEKLAEILPSESVLVPMPGRFGYAAYTLMLAIRIAMKGGFRIENCLKGEVRDGLCEMKRAGMKPTEPVFRKRFKPTKGARHVLIDNVYDTGMTARAAQKAMGKKCEIAVIGITKADKQKQGKIWRQSTLRKAKVDG